ENRLYLIIRITITGIVQGVGFRPFVYRSAISYNLVGFVRNINGYIEILIQGNDGNIKRFISDILEKNPFLAKVEGIKIEKKDKEQQHFESFRILQSSDSNSPMLSFMSPDKSICNDCIKEIFDINDRRYKYHFNACINCGPRFTLIKDIPFDRNNTSMIDFKLCNKCIYEYNNPQNKRFFDQLISCSNCGPCLQIIDNMGIPIREKDPIKLAAKLLKEGSIIAIKGIGGFHIASSAFNSTSISKLRIKKKRPGKPFAVMSKDFDSIRIYAVLNENEMKILMSKERPIVLLKKNCDYNLSPYVSPHLYNIGVMLPFTSFHYLLFDHLADQPAIVMTSANLNGVPIIMDNDEAVQKLGKIVDYFLIHNRKIENRCDDSVIKVNSSNPLIIRRSRGYVPEPISLRVVLPTPILSFGAELNVVLTLMIKDKAFLSPHIGNIDNLDTYKLFKQNVEYFINITGYRPQIIVCDLHPSMNTTRLAFTMSNEFRIIQVQHHHAHLASLMAEHDVKELVGIVCDGFGYGRDAKAWGGEILFCRGSNCQRLGHLMPQPMIGGDLATYYPLRMVAGILNDKVEGLDDFLHKRLICTSDNAYKTKYFAESKKNLSMTTTSTGRILDAISSLLDICYERTYEGEPAQKLESAAIDGQDINIPLSIKDNVLDTTFLLQYIYENRNRYSIKDLAYSAHSYIARGMVEISLYNAKQLEIKNIGFSGGVVYNQIITQKIKESIEFQGLRLLLPKNVPAGDGGISFGQGYVAHLLSKNL
ncbi:MAG TPA: carbamoyltransferase HypF, partial [Verrucomicrobiae bacterium]|nr:carbamoyltransferase HypF [Verrucomicrobiae bacterium]